MAHIIHTAVVLQLLLLLTGSNHGQAFVPLSQSQRSTRVAVQRLTSLPSHEESANALTEYMTKAHEEKLKAVKAAEEKKQAEIEALKAELSQLKVQASSGGPLVTVAAPTGSLEELQQKLVSYQNFMAKYIVESQEAKIRAIADAQAATARKYEAILLSATTTLPPSSNTNVPANANPSYVARNAQVRAAAASGKSRWGSAELQRLDAAGTAATKIDLTTETLPAAAPAPPVVPLSQIPPEVFAADHGLRADGGVGGLTLAERVVGGAAAGLNTAAAVVVPPEKVFYHQRNQKVAQTGSKSRWGPMEVDRAKQLASLPLSSSSSPSTTTVSPDVVEKADHGLRADGGVGGPSLAERVNFGAQLLGVQ